MSKGMYRKELMTYSSDTLIHKKLQSTLVINYVAVLQRLNKNVTLGNYTESPRMAKTAIQQVQQGKELEIESPQCIVYIENDAQKNTQQNDVDAEILIRPQLSERFLQPYVSVFHIISCSIHLCVNFVH